MLLKMSTERKLWAEKCGGQDGRPIFFLPLSIDIEYKTKNL